MLLIYAHKNKKKRSLMAEKTQEEPANQSKSLTDSDTSDDTKVNPRFKASVEERQYKPIPGSVTATHIVLSHSRACTNPTVERGPPRWKVKAKKSYTDKTKDKPTDAKHKGE